MPIGAHVSCVSYITYSLPPPTHCLPLTGQLPEAGLSLWWQRCQGKLRLKSNDICLVGCKTLMLCSPTNCTGDSVTWRLEEYCSQHQSAQISTSQHKSAPVNKSQHKSSPVSKSQHQSAPVSTSQHQSAPVSTSQHQSAPFSTSQHHSASVSISQHQFAPVSTSQH